MDNIVIVVPSTPTYGKAPKVYQYNYGQILRIQGLNLPKVAEVHFSYNETYGDSVTRIANTKDGVTDVLIPDSFLEYNDSKIDYTVYAYIYLEDGTSGETVCKIDIPVKARSKPEVPGTPEEPELFRETVKSVNDAADRAEQAEQNAKASATEAGKYATSASESATAAEKTKEDALREVGDKKQEAIEAIQKQEETSVGKIINHTDNEIQRIQEETAGSKKELEQTITDASVANKKLEESIQTAGDAKTALDKSTELAGTAKTELDTSTKKAGEAKTALDGSTKTAGEMQETLSETVKQAGTLDTSLGEKIEAGTQLKTDLVASGEKAVQDIQTAGSEQLGKMQAVAEEFTVDREQITTNKEDISSLKEEMGKNYLDDAKTKRSLDALWKLNQGISYQFETDTEKAYQKDIPSGAKLVSVKKIGGRTIVWNQLANVATKNNVYLNDRNRAEIKIDSAQNTITATLLSEPVNNYHTYITYTVLRFEKGHKYLFSAFFKSNKDCVMRFDKFGSSKMTTQNLKSNIERLCADILICNEDDANNGIQIYPAEKDSGFLVGDWYSMRDFKLFDLTKMFGAGNEPSTPEEFEAMFSEDYYEYNEGALISIPVNGVVEQGKNLLGGKAFADKIVELGGTLDEANGKVSIEASVVSNKTVFEFPDESKSYTIILSGENTNTNVQSANLKTDKGVWFNRFVDRCSITTVTGAKRILGSYNTQIAIYDYEKCGIFEGVLTADDFKPYHKKTYPIPQAILDLDGYGNGVSDDVYNYVDWENKQYHKRVGKVDLGRLDWEYTNDYLGMPVFYTTNIPPGIASRTINIITSRYIPTEKVFSTQQVDKAIAIASAGTVYVRDNSYSDKDTFVNALNSQIIYYELAEEQLIDISDIIDSTFQEPIEVEAGGTLTFHNSNGDGYQLPIPNEEEYIVSLAEVGGGASE